MKWFKHDSDAHADAKLERILIKYGADGYAIYWYCLELIAAKVDKNHCTFELEHDAELIGYKLKIDTLRVEEIMRYMVSIDLFQINQETRRVMCLQLAKRLDEYSTKALPPAIMSRQYPDDVPTVSGLDKIRIEEKRIRKKYILSGKPDVVSSDFDVSCKAIILALNALAGTHFKHDAKGTRRLIKARFQEGATLQDFEKVIKIKVEQWADDEKFKGYLRPETLFAANHFESYRNDYEIKHEKGE